MQFRNLTFSFSTVFLILMLLVPFSCQRKAVKQSGELIKLEEVKKNTQQKPVAQNERATDQYVKPVNQIPVHRDLVEGELENGLFYRIFLNQNEEKKAKIGLLLPKFRRLGTYSKHTIDLFARTLLLKAVDDDTTYSALRKVGIGNELENIYRHLEDNPAFLLSVNLNHPVNFKKALDFLSAILSTVMFTEADLLRSYHWLGKNEAVGSETFTADLELLNQLLEEYPDPENIQIIGSGDFEGEAQIQHAISGSLGPLDLLKSRIRNQRRIEQPERAALQLSTNSKLNVFKVQFDLSQPFLPATTQKDIRLQLLREMTVFILEKSLNRMDREGIDLSPFSVELNRKNESELQLSIKTYTTSKDQLIPIKDRIVYELNHLVVSGVSQEELNAASKFLKKESKLGLRAMGEMRNEDKIDLLAQHIVYDKPLLDPSQRFSYLRTILPLITRNELNHFIRELLMKEPGIQITCPSSENISAVRAIMEGPPSLQEGVYENMVPQQTNIPDSVFREFPQMERVEVKKNSGDFPAGLQMVELANGLNVYYLQNKSYKDDIRCLSFKKNNKLIPEIDIQNNNAAYPVLLNYPYVGLIDQLARPYTSEGHIIDIVPLFQDNIAGFYGKTTPEDLEYFLRVLYHLMSENFSESGRLGYLEKPNIIIQDEDSKLGKLSQFEPGIPRTDKEGVEFNPAQIRGMYPHLYNFSKDYSVLFTGNFNPLILIARVQKYLGNLPADREMEFYSLEAIEPSKIITTHSNTSAARTKKAELSIMRQATDSPKDFYDIGLLASLLEDLISDRLIKEGLRHFAIEVHSSIGEEPGGSTIAVNYRSGLNQEELINKTILAVVESLKSGDIEKDMIDHSYRNYIDKFHSSTRSNEFLLRSALNAILTGDYTELKFLEYFDQMINEVDMNRIVLLATLYLEGIEVSSSR